MRYTMITHDNGETGCELDKDSFMYISPDSKYIEGVYWASFRDLYVDESFNRMRIKRHITKKGLKVFNSALLNVIKTYRLKKYAAKI